MSCFLKFLLVLVIYCTFGWCQMTTIYPSSIATLSGYVSNNNLNSLRVKDQGGTQDNWERYVEFYGTSVAYSGVFSFTVPNNVASTYKLNVNFRGPQKRTQSWKFDWYVPSSNSFVFAGDNAASSDWMWSSLSFDGMAPFSSLVNSERVVKVRFTSEQPGDDCNIDFLQILTFGSSESSATTSTTTAEPSSTSRTTSATSSSTATTTTSSTTSKSTTSAPSTTTSKSTTSPAANGKRCPAGSWVRPTPGITWQWQLTGTVDTSVNVQLYDIDMFGASVSLINNLHGQGRVVICYIDTAYEPDRPDSSQFTSAVLGNDIDGWPGQKWVDIRSSVVRNIMRRRLEQAASKNCDGVEMDDVDAYQNNPGFPLTANDQLSFNSYLATEAHKLDLGIGLKNDLEQVTGLAPSFDFAVNEQCYQYGECGVLSTFVSQGKAVLGVEYELSTGQFCSQANSQKFSWLRKNLDLDAPRTACCSSNCGGSYECVSSSSRRSENFKITQLKHDGGFEYTQNDDNNLPTFSPLSIFIEDNDLLQQDTRQVTQITNSASRIILVSFTFVYFFKVLPLILFDTMHKTLLVIALLVVIA